MVSIPVTSSFVGQQIVSYDEALPLVARYVRLCDLDPNERRRIPPISTP